MLDPSAFANDFSGGVFGLTSDGSSLVVRYNWVPVPPTLSINGAFSNGSFPLLFSGSNGQAYEVLATTNLALPMAKWTVLTNGTFGDGPAFYTDITATNGARYYQIVLPP